MNSGRHVDRWLSGLLAAVCVLLIRNLIGEIKSSILPLYRRPAVAAHLASFRRVSHAPTAEQARSQGVRPIHSSSVAEARLSQPQPRDRQSGARPPTAHMAAQPIAQPMLPQATVQPSPQPAVAVLQPIGYVEDGDGRREAVVQDGDDVRIVHEGDAYGEHAQIVKITPSAIEIAELPPQPSAPSASAVAEKLAGQADTVESSSMAAISPPAPLSQTAQVLQVAQLSGSTPTANPLQQQPLVMRAGNSSSLNQTRRSGKPVTSGARVASSLVSHPLAQRIDAKAIIPPPVAIVALKPQSVSVCCPDFIAAPQYIGADAGLPISSRYEPSGQVRPLPPLSTTPTSSAWLGTVPPPPPPPQQEVAQAQTEKLGYVKKWDGEVDDIIAVSGAVKLVPKTELQNRDFQLRADRAKPAPVAKRPRDLALTSRPSWPGSTPNGESHTGLEPETLSIPMPWSAQPTEAFLEGQTSGKDPPLTAPDSWQGVPLPRSRSGPTATGPPGELSLPKPDTEAVTNLPTLGYAQMADGQVVAILPEGDSVRLVRQGEALGEGISVAQVYQTSIDVAHPSDLRVTPLVARDSYNVGEFAATPGLRDLQVRRSSVAVGRSGPGLNLQPPGVATVEMAETKPFWLPEQVNPGCTDGDPDVPQQAEKAALEAPENLDSLADGHPEPAVADEDKSRAVEDGERDRLNAPLDNQPGLPTAIARDLYQRPPPGFLPFEDVDASPGCLAPGNGEVCLSDPLSQPTVLEGNSDKAHPGSCRRRKQ